MKKIYTYLLMAMMAFPTIMTMTSCDRDSLSYDRDSWDRDEARTLDGTWTGYIETYYRDRWGKTGDAFRTSMYFHRENPFGGWGYEIDYNVGTRFVDYYCEFRWEVINGRIHIKYADSINEIIIYDYRLSSNYFEGYMDDGTSREIYFRLAYDGNFDWNSWRNTWRRSQQLAPAEKTEKKE